MANLYLVTGATGHLGNTIIQKLLQKGCHVRGLALPSDQTPPFQSPNMELIRGDLRDIQSLIALFKDTDENTVLIHTAAILSAAPKFEHLVYDINVNGTEQLLRMCIMHHTKKFIYVSSSHAIPITNTIIKESNQFNADALETIFAKTKAIASRLVLDYGAKGLDACILQPSGMLGPGDYGTGHLTQLIMDFMNHKTTIDVKGGYDFVDVRDVADAVISSINNGISGESYLCTNQYYEVQQLFQMLQKITGRKPVKTMVPMWFSKLMVYFHQNYRNPFLQPPLTTSYELYSIPEKITFSHQKAKKQLHYTPRPIEETLLDTAQWLVCHHMVQPRPLGCKI